MRFDIAASVEEERQPAERFRIEARAIANLKHPNIVTVHQFGEEASVAYLVIKVVSGGSLRMRLSSGAGWSRRRRFASSVKVRRRWTSRTATASSIVT